VAIRTQGGLPLLLKLMEADIESEATVQAAAVIRDMADVDTDEGLAAIRVAGAIPSLVRMLKVSGLEFPRFSPLADIFRASDDDDDDARAAF
jgi:hypothetical protein